MVLTIVFGVLAALSIGLLAWQVLAAHRFPLHRHESDRSFAPPVILLKPLKGSDAHTADCLRSWLVQDYPGEVVALFGVAESHDPACAVVRALAAEFPGRVELVLTPEQLGANAKVSNLWQLYRAAQRIHTDLFRNLICISDADVRVRPDFLANAVHGMQRPEVGLVTSFYRMANPSTSAMYAEAVAVNADFWSQVLQANTLKRQDFALGAVMITRPRQLEQIGGFHALTDYLADDFELGNRIAKTGQQIELCTAVAECWDPPLSWKQVWAHQLRWARTIRVSQPVPYFFSILNNVSLWTTAFLIAGIAQGIYRIAPGYPWHVDLLWITCCILVWACASLARITAARHLYARISECPLSLRHAGAVIAKDWMQFGVWSVAFLGNKVVWRGKQFRVLKGGKLVPVCSPAFRR